jgi:hypothetical protein
MQESVRLFRISLRDCPDVWHYGQFVWRRMLLRLGTRGKPTMTAGEYYNACMRMFNQDKLGDIEPWVQGHGVYDDGMLGALFNISKELCRDYVGFVARLINNKHGGLKGCFSAAAPYLSQGHVHRSAEFFGRPWAQIVRYDKGLLAMNVDRVKRCLDAGYLVIAGVVSGVLSGDLSHPEHYVLVIGYDGDEFVFWDADSLVSNRPPFGPAFGTFTYHHPDDPAARFHRFGTARDANELKCNDVGNFTLGTPSNIDNVYRGVDLSVVADFGGQEQDFRIVNHRYQVTLLAKV